MLRLVAKSHPENGADQDMPSKPNMCRVLSPFNAVLRMNLLGS